MEPNPPACSSPRIARVRGDEAGGHLPGIRDDTSWRVALSLALAAGGCTALAFVALTATGVEPAVAAKFLIYVGAFSLLPGIVVTRMLLPRLATPGTFLIYALSAGLTLDVLLFMPLWALGHSNLFRALPLLAAAALLLLARRLRLRRLLDGWVVGRSEVRWIGGALLLCATPLLTIGYLLTQDHPSYYSSHFAFQGVIVRSLALGWPPPNLLLADVPLSYNYAAHLWLLAAHESTGLPVETLVARTRAGLLSRMRRGNGLRFRAVYLGAPLLGGRPTGRLRVLGGRDTAHCDRSIRDLHPIWRRPHHVAGAGLRRLPVHPDPRDRKPSPPARRGAVDRVGNRSGHLRRNRRPRSCGTDPAVRSWSALGSLDWRGAFGGRSFI